MAEPERNHVLPSKPPSTVVGRSRRARRERTGAAPAEAKPIIVVRNLALTVMAALAVILVLQYAQSVLVPIVLGVLISYGLAPFVGALDRTAHSPRVRRRRCGHAPGGRHRTGHLHADAIRRWPSSAISRRRHSGFANACGRIGSQQRRRAGKSAACGHRDRSRRAGSRDASGGRAGTAAREKQATGVQKVEVVQPPFRASDYLWSGGVGLARVSPDSSCSCCFSSTSFS